MKPAEGMVTAGGHKAIQRNSDLVTEIGHEFIQGIAVIIAGQTGNTSEPGDRLKMNPTYGRGERDSETDQISEVPGIYTLYDGGHQRDTKSGIGADMDGFQLGLQERRAAQCLEDPILGPVKLEKDNVKARFYETAYIVRILCQTEPIGIHLRITAAGFFGVVYQLRQIIPQGGFASGEL